MTKEQQLIEAIYSASNRPHLKGQIGREEEGRIYTAFHHPRDNIRIYLENRHDPAWRMVVARRKQRLKIYNRIASAAVVAMLVLIFFTLAGIVIAPLALLFDGVVGERYETICYLSDLINQPLAFDEYDDMLQIVKRSELAREWRDLRLQAGHDLMRIDGIVMRELALVDQASHATSRNEAARRELFVSGDLAPL